MNLLWDEYKIEFLSDGSLRDLYIKHTNLDDWQSFINTVRSMDATLKYKEDGKIKNLPENIKNIVHDNEHSHLLSILVNGISINCHFFVSEEIELDVSPKEIYNENKAKTVFNFMSIIGDTLKKDVILTPENEEESSIFQYNVETGLKYFTLNKTQEPI